MKVFITGAEGQLARYLSESFTGNTLYLATKKHLDVTNRKKVFDQISAFKPDLVIHLASITRGDECAANPEKAFKVNVEGTKNVIEACKKNNSALLFISTNEVYDGKKKSPYNEKDIPNPLTVVGKTKYEAEKLIQDKLEKFYIIRTSWLYGKWSRNFLHVIIDMAKQDKTIKLVMDEVSSPTYSYDLAIAIKKLVMKKKYGIYHLVNAGYASRLEFAKYAINISGFKVNILPIKLEDFKRLSKPPLFTPLDNEAAARLGIVMPEWEEALVRFMKVENFTNEKK